MIAETQRRRILDLLSENVNQWVPLYKIMDLRPRIAQYNARIKDLRDIDGFEILNDLRTIDGEKHSCYMLVIKSPVQAFQLEFKF